VAKNAIDKERVGVFELNACPPVALAEEVAETGLGRVYLYYKTILAIL